MTCTRHHTRREVLQAAAVAAATLALPPIARTETRTAAAGGQPFKTLMHPVDFSQVTFTDAFWAPKQQKVATATLAACIHQTEQKTGRIRNFEKAAQRKGEHEGIWFDDSDVYKAIEAIAYSLKNRPDAQLEKKADEWIAKIAAAQLPDGYLNTYYTLKGLDQRWTDMDKHEDYCAGHLIEAAIAYYRTSGKRTLLDVAIRFADYLDATFRVPNRHWVTGHEEIELALMKLYHLTGTQRYLQLAEWYLDQRGRGYGKGTRFWGEGGRPEDCQDSIPVKQQRVITGHAVRAMYLYSGVADVGAAIGDSGYMQAMTTVWQDVVHRNLYLTGGIGSTVTNEGFSEDFDLPNSQAYCETCASVGMVFWNHRMALLTGESKYIDVLERSLYNGALDGLSLSGDRFFYANPLASSASNPSPFFGLGRSQWFGTACCPSNISRLVASLGSYLYGVSDRGIWVNLFVASSARLKVGRTDVELQVATNYPWDGNIRLTLSSWLAQDPVKQTAKRTSSIGRFALHLRIPGWSRGVAVPGDLYKFTSAPNTQHSALSTQHAALSTQHSVLVNGKAVRYRDEKGYAVIERQWNRGDVVELQLPMPVQQVVSRDEVKATRDRLALQRGPLVYCVEGADNGGNVWNLIASTHAVFTEQPHRILDESVVALRGEAMAIEPTSGGLSLQLSARPVIAIPYYTWANRDNYEMQVWLPTKIEDVKINA